MNVHKVVPSVIEARTSDVNGHEATVPCLELEFGILSRHKRNLLGASNHVRFKVLTQAHYITATGESLERKSTI